MRAPPAGILEPGDLLPVTRTILAGDLTRGGQRRLDACGPRYGRPYCPCPSERIARASGPPGAHLIGRRVRILAWADYGDLFRHYCRYGMMPPQPVGTVTGEDDYGAGHLGARGSIPGAEP